MDSTDNLTFGEAIDALKCGKHVTRPGWNGNQRPPTLSPKPIHTPTKRLEIVGAFGFLLGSKGGVAVFDASLLPRLRGKEEFTEGSGGYFVVSFYEGEAQENLKLHQLLFDCPKDYTVDHISGDRLDNRAENIRFATDSEQHANRGPTRDGYKGVAYDKERDLWIAAIQSEGKTKHLGRFSTEAEAARAYDIEAWSRHGQFARLNFPNEPLPPRMYLWLMPAMNVKAEWCREPHLKYLAEANGGQIECLASIRMYTVNAEGKRAVLTGWLASQTDMTACDWQILDPLPNTPTSSGD